MDFKDLKKRSAFDKVLRDQEAFNMAKNPIYDRY